MDQKGYTFTDADIPARARARMTPEQQQAWCDERTERFRVVAEDERGPIIAEELEERSIRKLVPPEALSLTRTLARARPEIREAALAAFDEDGALRDPFSEG